MEIRIVLLPDEKTNLLVEGLSRRVSASPSLFTLDNAHIPHITLVHFQSDESTISNINPILTGIAGTTASVIATANKIAGTDDGFIGIYFKEDEEITKLRYTIREKLKSFIPEVSPYTVPHVTLTRLINSADMQNALQTVADFYETPYSFRTLAICESGAHGVCIRLISSFQLQL